MILTAISDPELAQREPIYIRDDVRFLAAIDERKHAFRWKLDRENVRASEPEDVRVAIGVPSRLFEICRPCESPSSSCRTTSIEGHRLRWPHEAGRVAYEPGFLKEGEP